MAEKFKVLIEIGVKGKSGHWGHQSQPGHKGGSLPKDGQGSLSFPKQMRKTTTSAGSVDQLLQKVKDSVVSFGSRAWEKTKGTLHSVPISTEIPGERWDVGNEFGYLVNMDGTEDKNITGTHNQMDVPDDWDMTDKVFVHTHPSSPYFDFTTPLSDMDLLACISRGAKVISVYSDKGVMFLARRDGPNPIDKNWGVTPTLFRDTYMDIHEKNAPFYRSIRDSFLTDAIKKGGPPTPRERHMITMKATHIANCKNWADMAERFGWTLMYIPEKGYAPPPHFKEVNPWRIK